MYTVSFHNTQQVYTSYGEVKVKFLWEGKTIKGGKIWYSEFTGSWSGWSDVTSNVQNVGSGAIKCFNTYTDSDGYIKQHLVKGTQVWYRENVYYE